MPKKHQPSRDMKKEKNNQSYSRYQIDDAHDILFYIRQKILLADIPDRPYEYSKKGEDRDADRGSAPENSVSVGRKYKVPCQAMESSVNESNYCGNNELDA